MSILTKRYFKALALLLVTFFLVTFSIGFFDFRNTQESLREIAKGETRVIETNSSNLNFRSIGLYEKTQKVLIASKTSKGTNYVFTAPRESNQIDSFLIERALIKKVDSVKLPLLDSSPLHFQDTVGVKKSRFFIFDLLVDGFNLYASVVERNTNPLTCDLVGIYVIPLDSNGNFQKGPSVFWQWNKTCIKWINSDPSGNLSMRLASNSESVYISVGLESVLPYTFLYPNPAIQHLPFTFSESREKFPLFGSVLEIKKGQLDNSYSLVARGFRSPQGLYYDQKRKVLFNSDHGPRGGDEINIIRLDKHSTPDYGWPNVTLGDYYSERGNLKTTFLTHFGYENPIYFWTPSIAPSQVIVFNGFKKVSEFDESVLLATLKSQSIYRIFFDSDYKVKNIEAIYIGKRIRDLDKFQTFIVGGTDTGELFILEDSGTSTHDGAFPKFETPQTPISSGIIDYIRLFTNKVKAFLS